MLFILSAGRKTIVGLLILVRHGESCWNAENIFTGWVDIPLSSKGIEEAFQCGLQLADIPIDTIYTSTLIRAQMTAFLFMSKHHSKKVPVVQHEGEDLLSAWGTIHDEKTKLNTIPVYYSSALNERMYGVLQGLNKAETAKEFGPDQVQIWRRSYDINPPEGESLKDTAKRALPYFEEVIFPEVKKGKTVIVFAHGNSIRAACKELDGLSDEKIVSLEIPTGKPIIYKYDENKFIKQ